MGFVYETELDRDGRPLLDAEGNPRTRVAHVTWTCPECSRPYASQSAAETCEQIDNGTAYQQDY